MRFFAQNGQLSLPWVFNRERVILTAMQDDQTVYQLLDSNSEGLGHSQMRERRRIYGSNQIGCLRHKIASTQLPAALSDYCQFFEKMMSHPVAIFRHGLDVYIEEPYEEIVPGDVIFLSEGDAVPADVRLLAVNDLRTDACLLTGEHRVMHKTSSLGDYTCTMSSIVELPNICFAGEEILSGSARGVVVATGLATCLANLILGQ